MQKLQEREIELQRQERALQEQEQEEKQRQIASLEATVEVWCATMRALRDRDTDHGCVKALGVRLEEQREAALREQEALRLEMEEQRRGGLDGQQEEPEEQEAEDLLEKAFGVQCGWGLLLCPAVWVLATLALCVGVSVSVSAVWCSVQMPACSVT